MILKSLLHIINKYNSVNTVVKTFLKPNTTSNLCKNCVQTFSTGILKLKKENECLTTDFNQQKSKVILSLNFKSKEDSMPFIELPLSQLYLIQRKTLHDKKHNFCENRLYYIASKIKCPPAVVSKQLAKRTFVYTLSFGWLEESLNALLEIGITGDRILRDLWVLKYNHKTIRQRLQKIKELGVDVLYPWMVRCSPTILDRYITQTQETRSILGESKSTKKYLAERLCISKEDVDDMLERNPSLRTIRATKIKKFLDFLIDEGFTLEDITKRLRVLSSSQKTIKHRLDMVRSLGQQDINLNILCRSRKDFQKYVDTLKLINESNSEYILEPCV